MAFVRSIETAETSRNEPSVEINLFTHANSRRRQSRTLEGSKGRKATAVYFGSAIGRLREHRQKKRQHEFLLTPLLLLLLLDSSSSSSSAPLPSSFFVFFLASPPLLFARLFVCSVSFRPVKRDLINSYSLISPPSPLQAYWESFGITRGRG